MTLPYVQLRVQLRAQLRARTRCLLPVWMALLAAPAGGVAQAAAGTAAQGTVHAASLVADVSAATGVAMVRMEYQLNGIQPGELVPVSLLDFGDAVAGGFLLGAAGASADLPHRYGAARTGSWPVEAGPGGRAVLAVAYQVPRNGDDGSGRIVTHLPVLTVDRAPEEARPGLFHGSVRVPTAWAVTEGFPTGLASAGDAGRYDVELSVVPAVVTLRARSDGRGVLALPVLLDLVALAALVITAVAGWRHMREPSS